MSLTEVPINKQTEEQNKDSTEEKLTLQQLRKLIPKQAMNPPSTRNFIEFVVKFSMFLVTFYFSCTLQSIWLIIPLIIINGAFLFSLGTVGHDCGHGSYIRPRWLNEAIGELCMSLHGMVYAGWKHFHNTHHAHTNQGELDPDRLWLYEDEFLAFNKVERFFWKLFHTKCFWLSAVGHYFRAMLPWPFIIKQKTEQVEIIQSCQRGIFTFFAILIAFHTSAFFLGLGLKSLIIHVFSLLVAFACLSIYVRTEHYLLTNNYDVQDKPWLTSRTITQNRILDFFANNLNYHVEHHILQSVPHANLPSIRPTIKKTILEAKQPYPEDTFWNFMKIAFNQEFFVLERNTFKEIPLSKLQLN
ncbi:MAG: fatty acid desaturase [Candidatus Caenarcaniphilales bacterium]|nr:fatty acid desaturase [Candidatus Caenarcaniphilales bacterium]